MEKKKLNLDIDSYLFHFGLPRFRSGEMLENWINAKGELTAELEDLTQIVFILRKLKALILSR